MIDDLPKVGLFVNKSFNKNNTDKDNKRMEYVLNFFKGMFFSSGNNKSTNSTTTTTGVDQIEKNKSISINFRSTKTKENQQQLMTNEKDSIECHGWWEVICLHKIPNDLQFVSASCSIYESDDLFSAFERLKSIIKEIDQDNWIDDLNHKHCWFREIPDGISTRSLRHYLLTPGMRFLIISQSSEDIQTFVLQSGFKHWIHGIAPFNRQFQWPLIFTRLVNREHFPNYICDYEEANKILKGEDRSNSLTNSDDETTEHYHLKPSVFSSVSLLLHPHELINDDDSSLSHNEDSDDSTHDDNPIHSSLFYDNQ